MAKAKNKFGYNQLKKPTPMWATWIFRISFLLVTVAIFVISGDELIKAETKVRICLYLKGAEALIYGLSKMIGIEVQPEPQEQQQDNESESHI